MKTKGLFLLPLAVWAISVSAQPLTLDENGHGTNTVFGIQPGLPVPFQVGPDPSGGIIGQPVLMYFMSYRVYAGDVELVGNSGPTDLIRFVTPPGTNTSLIIFYSNNDGDGALADVGLPPSVSPFLFNENNPDPWWRPSSGQPGALLPGQTIPVGTVFWYRFLSDVPEPHPAVLLLMFGVLSVATRHSIGICRRDALSHCS